MSGTSSYSVRGTLFLSFLLQSQNKLTSLYSVLDELRRSYRAVILLSQLSARKNFSILADFSRGHSFSHKKSCARKCDCVGDFS